jgi:valine--pyruvate aminotransferase
VAQLRREIGDHVPMRIHKPEGALFLWLWFEGLPISSQELYQRLKKKGVLVVSGHYFFPGMEKENWEHKGECIRVTYAQDEEVVAKGIRLIAEEIIKVFAQ